MTNFVIVETKVLRQNNSIFEHLGNISHPLPFPSNNVDFSISNTAQMATPAQHCIEGGPWISGNYGQMHVK